MRARLGEGPAGLQPPDDREPPMVTLGRMRVFAIDEGLGAYWNRDIERTANFDAEEAGLRDADDLERFAIEEDFATDGRGLAAIFALPVRIAEHCARRAAARAVVCAGEDTSKSGDHAESLEEIAARVEPLDVSHFATRRSIEAVRGPGKEAREGLLMGSELVPKSIGEVGASAAGVARAAFLIRSNFNFDQFLGVGHGQCSQAHRVEQVEDGGVGADAEREAQNRYGEEARFETKEAKGVAQILPERFEKTDGVPAVGSLLSCGNIAEFAARREGGFPRMHAARDIVVDFVLEMGLDFEGEISIALRTLEVFRAISLLTPLRGRARGRWRRRSDPSGCARWPDASGRRA